MVGNNSTRYFPGTTASSIRSCTECNMLTYLSSSLETSIPYPTLSTEAAKALMNSVSRLSEQPSQGWQGSLVYVAREVFGII